MGFSTVGSAMRRAYEIWSRVPERTRFVGAGIVAVLAVVACIADPANFKLATTETTVLVLSALVLRAIALALLSLVVAVCVAVGANVSGDEVVVSISGVVLLIAVAIVSVLQAIRRDRLGLGRTSAESVIGQVRRRLRVQGEVPALPDGWHVDVQQLAADGAAIAGDFVSSRLHEVDGVPTLEIVVVDVSGKGIEAGSRALLLSGAVGGLLGSVEPEEFLGEVNSYLNRQRWVSGFATCVYVRVNLETGAYSARTAGHPPPLARDAGGTWTTAATRGTLLGVVPTLRGVAAEGSLNEGHLLILVTDGVIEDRVASLEEGNARLRSAADHYLSIRRSAALQNRQPVDFAGGLAQRLVEAVPTRGDDDRAVVVIWREAPAVPEPSVDNERADEAQAADAQADEAQAGDVRTDRAHLA
ncbi:MAG: protein serine/threonine phosphatase [Jatrophihabitantaceae bacterium]|nr:protein serine/threonine phosphatase [Jatrophihabitantaceae bacterium]